DPALLRIVSSMHRAEARMRLIKKTAPLALATIALGTCAYFVAKALKPGDASPIASVTPSPSDVPTAVKSAVVVEPVVSTVASEKPPMSMGSAKPTAAVVASAPPPAKKERFVTITNLKPPFGVYVSIDGAAPIELTQGKVLSVDDKEHMLAFTCA